MKIIIIGPVPPYRGGIAHFTQALAENLVRDGNLVRVISYRKQYPKWLYPGKSDKDYSQSAKLTDTDFIFSPLDYLDWRNTLHAISTFEPDLVIYPWWTTFWTLATAWLLSRLNRIGIPTKVLIHNTFPHDGGWIDKRLTKFALKNARSFITMADRETERLKCVVKKGSKITTSAHPIYTQYPCSGLSKNEVRSILKLPTDDHIALFFGFVRPYKGLGVLFEALGKLKNSCVDIHLLVAGEFWDDLAHYQKQVQTLGLSHMITIRAKYIPDSEAGLYFEAADLFVAPYLEGTQSGSIKQAMSYELPLIVTDAIVDQMIMEYPFGVQVVPAGDPVPLAAAIQSTLTDGDYLNRSSQNEQTSWKNLMSALTNDHNQQTTL